MTQVTQLSPLFQTPDFANWSNTLKNSPPVKTGEKGEEIARSNYSIGEILANDPVRLESFLQSEYILQQAEQGNEDAISLQDNLDIDTANAMQEYLGRYVYDIREPTPIEPLEKQLHSVRFLFLEEQLRQ